MQWAGPPGGTVSPCFTSGHPNEYKLIQVDSGAFWEKTGSADTSFFSVVSQGLTPRTLPPTPNLAQPSTAHLSGTPWVSRVPLQKAPPCPGRWPNPWDTLYLLIGATFGTARRHIAPVSVVGRVFTHGMVGVLGGKEVQLPVALSAALAHCLGRQEIVLPSGIPFTRGTLRKA